MIRRAIIDLRSVLWTALLAGKDIEFGRKINFNGKEILINSAHHGYENAVDHIILVLEELKLQPRDIIFVDEGRNSKLMRQTFFPDYKAGRDRAPEQYEQFNLCKQMMLDAFLGLGAQLCWQDGMEADDVIAYVARKLQGERYIVTNDGDLAVCIDPDNGVHLFRQGRIDYNPYGPFSPKLIPVYKALVGDSSDGYGGAYKFGDAAFLKVLEAFGEEGLELLEKLIIDKQLSKLAEDVGEVKELQKVMDGAESVYTCYALARLHVEKVNTMRKPLQWRAGMVKPVGTFEDERLRKWAGQVRLIHAGNYDEAVKWAKGQIAASPFVTLDIETSTPEASDEWLMLRGKEEKVDVFGSELTGLGMTFGPNLQFTLYLSHDHVEEKGAANLTKDQVKKFVQLIPPDVQIIVHQAQFEIPVIFNSLGDLRV